MNKKAELFWEFFKVGLFTFGGGLAMISILEKVVIDKKKWITEEEMTDIIAIAESTPGPIAINSATFIGKKVGGITGAICSTFGTVLPSFIIILIISLFVEKFLAIKIIQYAFLGIRCGVGLLILKSALKMLKKASKSYLFYILLLISLSITILLPNISSIFVILGGGVATIIFKLISDLLNKKGKANDN